MGERFGRYSKYIIQERALPDIRDGLKPVQRRILYSMNKDGNTHDKGYRKSAKSVGNIMGISTLTGIVRSMMPWSACLKTGRIVRFLLRCTVTMVPWTVIHRLPCVIRKPVYLKLLDISLQDIEKNTVPFAWNFDDTEKEPTVLPAAFPNLLVNGATGISAGYATDIPPTTLLKSSMLWST